MSELSTWMMSAPVLTLSLGASLLLLLETFQFSSSQAGRKIIWVLAGLALFIALVMSPSLSTASVSYGRGMLVWDGLAFVALVIALIGGLFTLLMSASEGPDKPAHLPAFAALLLFSITGTILTAASQNFLMLFVAIELTSIPAFVLVAYHKSRRDSIQAALNFFLMGAFASAMIVYGTSLIYGLTGSVMIQSISDQSALLQGKMPLLLTALILIVSGLAFKMALVPFQWWLPEAFAGAPTPIAAYLSAAPKIAGLIVLLRVSSAHGLQMGDPLFTVIAALTAVTLVAGNVLGFLQGNLLRLLAYSSVSHMGFLMLGVLSGVHEGFPPIAFYSVVYLLMNFGAFTIIALLIRQEGHSDLRLLNGLAQRSPMMAAVMALFTISLAGLPPLAGFVAKFAVFTAAWQAGWTKLVVLALICTVLGCAYYFRILYAMYFQPCENNTRVRIGISDRLVLAVTSFFTVILGLFPQYLLNFLQRLIP